MATVAKLTLTPNSQSQVALIDAGDPGTVVESKLAGATLTPGDPVYPNTSGTYGLALSAASNAAAQFAGIALASKSSGQAIDIVRSGLITGFDLSGLAYGALVYLNDTGVLGTTAGTVSIVVGKVEAITSKDSSGNPLKALRIAVNTLSNY